MDFIWFVKSHVLFVVLNVLVNKKCYIYYENDLGTEQSEYRNMMTHITPLLD